MKFSRLGDSDLLVSQICLGTMTWGEQNTQEEAHQQLDLAFDRKVNFIDTAEMYPVPPRKETYSQTESIIGKWPKIKTHRDQIILASKIVGPMNSDYIRGGNYRFNKDNIFQALNSSLKRLSTDYLDLYQIHWPSRKTNFFGELFYTNTPDDSPEAEDLILETLEALQDCQRSGKIRTIGVSNETPWGTMKYLELARKNNLPKIVSIQNPYSLLNRSFEVGLSEISHREKVSLMSYSPLGFGVLSGKYLNGKKPEKARLTLYKNYQRYSNEEAIKATTLYVNLAYQLNLTPSQLALAFVNSRSFCQATIIGATKLEQLEENINSININLDQEALEKIDSIHKLYPIPSP